MDPGGLGIFELQLCLGEPLLNALLLLRAAASEALLELVLAGRGDEDEARGDAARLDLFDALHLDVQHDDFPLLALLANGRLGRAVAVAAELGVLDEAVRSDQGLEVVVADEVVVDGVLLARAGGPRRVADGEGEGVRVLREEHLEQRALADA